MIFIVDDDRSVRSSLSRLMRSAGYEALSFATAEEYLAAVSGTDAVAGTGIGTGTAPKREDGDCVILDLQMSGMNGLELQQILKHHEPPLPVIILTATEDAELRARALAAGAERVLRKPCDSAVLLQAVAEAIESPPQRVGTVPMRAADDAGDPAHFVLERGHGTYRPIGNVTFEEVVALVRAAIAAARRHQLGDLLVDTTALNGFPSPDCFERFLAAVEWAQEAAGGVRLAMVARAEMIDPQKLGVLVASNRGMISNIFPTEAEARAWLTA